MEHIVNVATPAASLDLTTLANVKTELSITDSTDDALLSRYIRAVSTAIAQFCNRTFPVQSYQEEYFRRPGTPSGPLISGLPALKLTAFPLIAVQSVTENGSALNLDVHYRAAMDLGKLIRINGSQTIQWQQFPVIVAYQAGFSTIPADIEDAAIRMVKTRYLARDRDPLLRQESIPGVRDVTYWVPTGADSGNMTPDITDILLNYREDIVL